MADYDKPIKIILTHPEMSRRDKILMAVSYLAIVWYILRPVKRRRG